MKPLKLRSNVKVKLFATVDIETISLNGEKVPIAISFSDKQSNKIFMVNTELFLSDHNSAIKEMFNDFFDYIFSRRSKRFCTQSRFFDGRYIFKYFTKILVTKLCIVSRL